MTLGVRFIHDSDLRRVNPIAIGKLSTGEQLNLVGREELRPGTDKKRIVSLWKRLPGRHCRLSPGPSIQWRVGRDRRREHTGQTLDFLQHCHRKRSPAIVEFNEQHTVGTKSSIERLEIVERAHKHPGGGEQYERQRHLSTDEERKQSRP